MVDWQIGNEAGHGVMTHAVQDLVIADAFAEAGVPLNGRTLRMKLRSAREGSGNVYMLGKDPPHRPETFYEYLKVGPSGLRLLRIGPVAAAED